MEKIRLNPYWPKMNDDYELRTDYEFVFAVPCDNCPIIDEAEDIKELEIVMANHMCQDEEDDSDIYTIKVEEANREHCDRPKCRTCYPDALTIEPEEEHDVQDN